MPDLEQLRQERFGLHVGTVGGVVYAFMWLIVLLTSGVIPDLIPYPLVVATLYLFGFTTAQGVLFAALWVMPRSLGHQSRQVLILAPAGLILAGWTRGEVLKAVDYRATDNP